MKGDLTPGAIIADNPFRTADRHMDQQPTIDDDCFAEAVRWHARLRGADADVLAAHATWLAADPRHHSAMAEVESLYGRLEGPVQAEIHPHRPRHAGHRRGLAGLAVAAGLILAVTAGVHWPDTHDASTAVGESKEVALADGSKVTLNTHSAIDVDIDGGHREVRLVRGEAFFQVAHDATRPFTVHTEYGQARVLGTVFDVRLDDRQTRVGVVEGRVAVQGGAGETLTLLAGDAATLDASGAHAAADGEADALSAWTRGQLVFYRAPLADVMREIDRYRHGATWVRGDTLRRLPVSGAFDVHDPDKALDAVVASLRLHRTRLGPLVTLVY